MKKFPVINITASTPFERGVEYGEQAKDEISICVEYYKKRFTDDGMDWEDVKRYSMTYADIVKEEDNELYQEAKGIAEGSGRSFEEIMVVNCRYEITKFPQIPECTTAAIMPESSAGNKLYIMKNWDYNQHIVPHLVLLKFDTEDGFKAFGISEAGQMIRDGMNGNGVAFVNNNLQSIYDHFDVGVPATFIRRRLLESKSFEEAKNSLVNAKRNVSCNTMIAGRDENVAEDFEAYPKGVNVLLPKDGVLTHANHFEEKPEIDALDREEGDRSVRFYEILKEQGNEITLEHIMECAKDHKFAPKAICSHPTNDEQQTKNRMTVASIIMNLTDGVAHVCAGNPCEGEYIEYKL